MAALLKQTSPSASNDLPDFAINSLQNISAKRTRPKVQFAEPIQPQKTETPTYDTLEATFADIDDEMLADLFDDNSVDDSDYEYHTDEDWEEDNDGDSKKETTKTPQKPKEKEKEKGKAKPKEKPPINQLKGLMSPASVPPPMAHMRQKSLAEMRHFKIRSVTIYGDLGMKPRRAHTKKIIKFKDDSKVINKAKTINFGPVAILSNSEDDDSEFDDQIVYESEESDDDSQNMEKIEIKRNYIKNEIIETEQTYLRGMRCLLNEFIKPIFSQKMIPLKYEKEVTSIIPMIIDFHTEFLLQLTTEFNNGKDGNMFEVFIKFANFLKMYIDYIQRYNGILGIFAKYRDSKKLKKYLQQKRREKKPLTNQLILPIQRIPRYMLLLEDLSSKTPETHHEYKSLSNALEIVKNVANFINEKKREIENISQCLQVMENLRELNRNIVEPHRKFLDQFLFRKKENQRPRQFFVFSDLIIITNLKFKVKSILEMRTVELKTKEQLKNVDSNEFRLFTATGHPIEYEVDMEDVDEIKKLNQLIIESREKCWDCDLSHMADGKSETRNALKVSGVSQSQHYRDQLEQMKQERIKRDEEALNKFKNSTMFGKKSKVLNMLGHDQ